MHIYAFYNEFSVLSRYGAMFQVLYFLNGHIDTQLESWVNGLIGGKFISRRGIMSIRWTRPTAIAVHLVFVEARFAEIYLYLLEIFFIDV